MCIHNGAFGTTDEVARRLFASFDVGGNVSLGLTEFSQMMQHVIGQELKPQANTQPPSHNVVVSPRSHSLC